MTWAEFRRKHPSLALSVELTMLWTLSIPKPFCALAAKCSVDGSELLDLDLSATLTLQGRDVLLEDIACAPSFDNSNDDLAEKFCNCLLADGPWDVHTELPDEVSNEKQVYYRGTIALDHWKMR